MNVELVNRGFSTLHNPRPVYLTLIDVDSKVWEQVIAAADPRTWQPFKPGDDQYRPLRHTLTLKAKLPVTIRTGWRQIGLWMPDASPPLRLDARYAVRVANRDVLWWTDSDGRYGVNVLGTVEIAAGPSEQTIPLRLRPAFGFASCHRRSDYDGRFGQRYHDRKLKVSIATRPIRMTGTTGLPAPRAGRLPAHPFPVVLGYCLSLGETAVACNGLQETVETRRS